MDAALKPAHRRGCLPAYETGTASPPWLAGSCGFPGGTPGEAGLRVAGPGRQREGRRGCDWTVGRPPAAKTSRSLPGLLWSPRQQEGDSDTGEGSPHPGPGGRRDAGCAVSALRAAPARGCGPRRLGTSTGLGVGRKVRRNPLFKVSGLAATVFDNNCLVYKWTLHYTLYLGEVKTEKLKQSHQ